MSRDEANWGGCGNRLRPDDFCQPPIADPHAGWCGEGRLITVPYPIGRFYYHFDFLCCWSVLLVDGVAVGEGSCESFNCWWGCGCIVLCLSWRLEESKR